VLPRRWVVERTFAWLNRCRRLAKDWENLNRNALASPSCSRDRAVEPDHKRHRVLRIHYAETLRAWRSNLFAKRKELYQAI